MKWEPRFPLDISTNGDDIDRFAQKTKAEFELIYILLNALRQNFPLKSQPMDTLPFQFYVDVSGGKIYMRNSQDTGWNVLGNVDEDYFGITAENIGAVENDGTVVDILPTPKGGGFCYHKPMPQKRGLTRSPARVDAPTHYGI